MEGDMDYYEIETREIEHDLRMVGWFGSCKLTESRMSWHLKAKEWDSQSASYILRGIDPWLKECNAASIVTENLCRHVLREIRHIKGRAVEDEWDWWSPRQWIAAAIEAEVEIHPLLVEVAMLSQPAPAREATEKPEANGEWDRPEEDDEPVLLAILDEMRRLAELGLPEKKTACINKVLDQLPSPLSRDERIELVSNYQARLTPKRIKPHHLARTKPGWTPP